jgi:ubiquitin C-terminal hydrolase
MVEVDPISKREYRRAGEQIETTQNPCYNMYVVCPLKVEKIKNKYGTEINGRLNSGNACYHSVQNLLSSHLLSKK